jgi:uncharacterized protein YutE (UPF0331/DUF86 family)
MIKEEKVTDLKERIIEKIKKIEEYLEEISDWLPEELEDYERDSKIRSACERNFELISEYLLDIAIYIIRIKKFRTPNDDESTFKILAESKIISDTLSKNMIDARGMRNFIAHRYGEIDNSKVFHALKEQFKEDVKEFLVNINKVLGAEK